MAGKQIKDIGAYLSTLKSFNQHLYGAWSLKVFGAKGDGVTDDTDAFKEAMAEIPAGGTLWLPDGNYIISDTIIRNEQITVIGAGSRGINNVGEFGTLISMNQPATNKTLFEFGFRNNSDKNCINLKGFAVDGGATTGDEFDLITVYNLIRHAHFEDLFLRSSAGNCIKLINDTDQTGSRNTYFYACAAENAKIGYKVLGDYNLNFKSCYAGFAMEKGFELSGANQIKIDSAWGLPGITDRFINILSSASIRMLNITNCHIDDSGGDGAIVVAAGSMGGAIANNVICRNDLISNIPKYGIYLTSGAKYLNVHDNTINKYSVAPIYDAGTSSNVHDNIDSAYKKDNNIGLGTILDGQTTLVVTHNLSSYLDANINIQVTPSKNETIWVDNITSTQFTVNRAASSGDLAFNWIGKSVMERKP